MKKILTAINQILYRQYYNNANIYCTMPECPFCFKTLLEYTLRSCISVKNRFSTFLNQFCIAGECLRIRFDDGASNEDCRRTNSFTSLLLGSIPFQTNNTREIIFFRRARFSDLSRIMHYAIQIAVTSVVLCFDALDHLPLHATLFFDLTLYRFVPHHVNNSSFKLQHELVSKLCVFRSTACRFISTLLCHALFWILRLLER